MKRYAIGFFVLLAIASTSFAADFRDASWGMTKDEVVASESETLRSSGFNVPTYSRLIGDSKINGRKVRVIYVFDKDDKLTKGAYLFTETEANVNNYYSNYVSVEALLLEKYGKPVYQEEIFDPMFKSEKGLALISGSGECTTKWNLDGGNFVMHHIKGLPDFEMNHLIMYTTYEAWDLENKIKRDSEKSKL